MSSFLKLIIKEVKRETKDAVSILFSVPEELQSQYTFIAGQYINLKLTLDNQEIRRAYSICSAPHSGELRIAVKAVSNGLFSQFANTKLKAGDVLEVENQKENSPLNRKPIANAIMLLLWPVAVLLLLFPF